MIHGLMRRISQPVVLACITSPLHADLTQQEFINAVGVLGLNPDVMAAAGVPETDLQAIYLYIAEGDDDWLEISTLRNAVRAALDELASNDGDMSGVEAAQDALGAEISLWRTTLLGQVASAIRANVTQIVSHSGSGLPAYICVKEWSSEELLRLAHGHAAHLRQQRGGDVIQTPALSYFLDALSEGQVIAAKANWEARHAAYAQYFAQQLSELD